MSYVYSQYCKSSTIHVLKSISIFRALFVTFSGTITGQRMKILLAFDFKIGCTIFDDFPLTWLVSYMDYFPISFQLKDFRPYLLGTEVEVIRDHNQHECNMNTKIIFTHVIHTFSDSQEVKLNCKNTKTIRKFSTGFQNQQN